MQREEKSADTVESISALERKQGQLTVELVLLSRGLAAAAATCSGFSVPTASQAGQGRGTNAPTDVPTAVREAAEHASDAGLLAHAISA